MRGMNINPKLTVLAGILILASTCGQGLAEDPNDPNATSPIYVDAGGPYSGTVGVPIEFDASLSFLYDGNDVENYYWDWHLDGRFDAFSIPICQHTWQCAYSGPVHLYIFDDAGNVDWDKAYVKVTGPETAMCVDLKSTADLHLYDACRRHVGLNETTNGPEMEIPKATFRITDDDGNALPLYDHLNDASVNQRINLPLYSEGPYQIKLVGAEDAPFALTVYGYQDGTCVAQETYEGDIFAGEVITVNTSACCKDDCLTLNCGALCYYPGLAVTPDTIDLSVDPDTTYEVVMTIRETTGLRPLHAVTLQCSNLTGAVYPINASDVTFDLNGFDLAPGATQEVRVTIPVPDNFIKTVTGSIRVECLDGPSKTVKVVIHRKGFHAPTCDPGGPYEGTVGEPITFNASGSHDNDGTITQYCWDWDWDGQFECTTDSRIQHTWDDVFAGTVLLRVIDDDGHIAEKSVSVTVKKDE